MTINRYSNTTPSKVNVPQPKEDSSIEHIKKEPKTSWDAITTKIQQISHQASSLIIADLSVISSKMTQTVNKIRSFVTLDGLAQVSIAACALIVVGDAYFSNYDPMTLFRLSRVTFVGSSVILSLWGVAKMLQGERKTGAKLLLTALAVGAIGQIVMHIDHDLHTRLNRYHARLDLSNRDLTKANNNIDWYDTQLDQCQNDLSIANRQIAESDVIHKDLTKSHQVQLDKFQDELQKAQRKIDRLDLYINDLEEKQQTTLLQSNQCQVDLKKAGEQITQLYRCQNDLRKAHRKYTRFDQCQLDLTKAHQQIAKSTKESFMDCIWARPEVQDATITAPEAKLRSITFGTTYIKGNEVRDQLSKIINANHLEYAERWDLEHRVVDTSLVTNKCDYPLRRDNKVGDCAPYWNKVALLNEWLREPQKPHEEEWYVIADDDMPVTNMLIDPYTAIDLLRKGKDTSFIIARDVVPWKDKDPEISVNTGVMFVRKDQASKQLIEKLWEKRNIPTGSRSDVCQTLGTCQNQDVLHEQEALAQIIKEDRSLLDRVITIVKPRDVYGPENKEIALNTFHRDGCFIRKQTGWHGEKFSYSEDKNYPEGKWKEGDWMGQTAGIPVTGWWCDDFSQKKPPGPIRQDMLNQMIAKVTK